MFVHAKNIQVQVLIPKVKPVEVQQNTIPRMFVENLGHQEKCDYLMALFIITSDISLR